MKTLAIIGLIILSFTIKNIYRFGYGFNDAFWRVVWAIDEGTIHADGFSEEKFNAIKVGMTKDQVNEILGKPLNDEDLPQNSFWYYTHHDHPTSDFDQRWVVFNSNNKVEEIRKSFFID